MLSFGYGNQKLLRPKGFSKEAHTVAKFVLQILTVIEKILFKLYGNSFFCNLYF
jgi:hypothetical protein